MANLRQLEKLVFWDEASQQFFPHYKYKEILPKWLGFTPLDPNQVNGVVTIPAAPGSVTIGWKQPYASVEGLDRNFGTPFEVRSLVYASGNAPGDTATADFLVTLRELGQVRTFMNRPVHIRTIAGVAQTPGFLREPYMFLSQHNIQAVFQDIAGGATTARMFMCGAEYYPWSPEFLRRRQSADEMRALLAYWMERRKFVNPYWLTTETQADVPAGTTVDFNLKIGDDGHFEAFSIACVATGNFSFQLLEPKTQQTIMNGDATQLNALGTANFPTLLPTAYLIPAGYRLRLTITDLSGVDNTIFFTLAGRKIYSKFAKAQEFVLNQPAPRFPVPADINPQIIPRPLV